jgi:Na+/H+ antiporter NhaC
VRSKLISAAAALALTAGPAAAAANTPPPAVQAPAPAAEKVEGSELHSGFILPLLTIIAVIIAVLLLTKNDDKPNSP